MELWQGLTCTCTRGLARWGHVSARHVREMRLSGRPVCRARSLYEYAFFTSHGGGCDFVVVAF
jgi:hypothetical protein